MAEVTSFRSNALPYPIYAQLWAVVAPLLDADGDPISPSSPDSEVSLNGNTFADCTNEATEIATSSGIVYLLLTAAEMTADIVTVQIKSTGAKTTVLTFYPRKLVAIRTGTSASAGSSTSTVVLDASASAVDDFYNGMVIAVVVDGTTEIRMIGDYTGSTQTCTICGPDFITAPDNNDTFTIFRPDGVQMQQANVTHWNSLTTVALPLIPTTAGRTLDVTAGGEAGIDWANVGSPTTTLALTGTTIATATAVTTVNGLAAGVITAASIAADAITAAKIADGAIDAATFAAGAINAAAIAADAITDAKVASDVTIASVTGAVGSVTAGVTLANGVTHGGTTALLRLGSSSSTPAFYATNSGGTAALFQSTGGGGCGLYVRGEGIGPGLLIQGDTGYALSVGAGGITTGSLQIVGNFVTTGSLQVGTFVDVGTNFTVNGSNAIPWNAAWDAEVQSEAQDAIEVNHLDHLLATAADGTECANGTYWARLVSKSATPAFSSFVNATDSLEALRDRGDAAWITATGFSTHGASDVWSVATRTLTAGTNIALAKGTGVTGFTDLSAGDVRTAVGLASANLDTQLTTIDDFLDTEIAAIKAKTDLIPAAPASTTNITSATGVVLAASGLDAITVTAPSTVATTFPAMLVQLFRRFFGKATKTDSQIKTYDGTTVITTQEISDSGGIETQGAAT